MLVLSRRLGEEIVIAGDIRVTVVAVDGNQVRLGIAAPTSVPVARLELLTECSGAAAPRFGRENGENRRNPGAR
jgi:carbon storage regulator